MAATTTAAPTIQIPISELMALKTAPQCQLKPDEFESFNTDVKKTQEEIEQEIRLFSLSKDDTSASNALAEENEMEWVKPTKPRRNNYQAGAGQKQINLAAVPGKFSKKPPTGHEPDTLYQGGKKSNFSLLSIDDSEHNEKGMDADDEKKK